MTEDTPVPPVQVAHVIGPDGRPAVRMRGARWVTALRPEDALELAATLQVVARCAIVAGSAHGPGDSEGT